MKLCALILDDQPDSTKIAQAALESRQFECVLASNSEQATQLLEERLPHLLVVDLSLGPEENGLDWLNAVRKGPFKGLPAIVMTSSASAEDVERSISMGVDDYIIKPANPAILKKKIMALQRRLQETLHYVYDPIALGQAGISGRIAITARISAVAETGFCLSSPIWNHAPFSIDAFESPLFQIIDIPAPRRLTFLNNEREPNRQSGHPVRNFCQAKGWVEQDFRRIRLWTRSQKLGRQY